MAPLDGVAPFVRAMLVLASDDHRGFVQVAHTVQRGRCRGDVLSLTEWALVQEQGRAFALPPRTEPVEDKNALLVRGHFHGADALEGHMTALGCPPWRRTGSSTAVYIASPEQFPSGPLIAWATERAIERLVAKDFASAVSFAEQAQALEEGCLGTLRLRSTAALLVAYEARGENERVEPVRRRFCDLSAAAEDTLDTSLNNQIATFRAMMEIS